MSLGIRSGFLLGVGLLGLAAGAQATPYTLKLDLARAKALESGRVSGELTLDPSPDERCLYLPFEDPDYEYDPYRGLSPSLQDFGKVERLRGRIRLQGVALTRVRPFLVKLAPSAEKVVVRFEAHLPRWPDRRQARWMYQDFYPQPLTACPGRRQDTLDYPTPLAGPIAVELSLARPWEVVAPATGTETQTEEEGARRFAFTAAAGRFAFAVAPRFKRHVFQTATTRFEIAHQGGLLDGHEGEIEALARATEDLLGPFPLGALAIVESDDLEKSRTPGMVVINRPKQAELVKDDNLKIHWTTWQIAYLLAEQWTAVTTATAASADDWFARGVADHVAYRVLKGRQGLDDFFAPWSNGKRFLTFSYRQANDLMAMLLTHTHPFNELTDEGLKSVVSLRAQHHLTYMRHSLALRQLSWRFGPDKFGAWLREFYEGARFRRVTPKDFHDFLAAKDPEAAMQLARWWRTDHWPDFRLRDVVQEGEAAARRIRVLVDQNRELALPVTVRLLTKDGQELRGEATSVGEHWEATFTTQGEVERVELDPDRETFDWNRFNNNNEGASFTFFPGGARTFKDDAHTVLWAPFFMKLPGEEFTLLLGAQTMRYLHLGITSLISHIPSEKRTGADLLLLTNFSRLATVASVNFSQDVGNELKGERLVEAKLTRKPLWFVDPVLAASVSLTNREVLGQAATRHQTGVFSLELEPPNPRRCNYGFEMSVEHTLGDQKTVRYRKDMVKHSGGCQLFSYGFQWRLFYGNLDAPTAPPGNVAFQPQALEGPRMRYDAPRLPATDRIGTVNLDVLIPARLPVASFLLALPRESRWRLFYDYGETFAPAENTYRDAGVGFFMPFGGDVVGKPTMSFLKLSVLGVLYRSENGDVSRKPGVLVDLLGKL